MSFWNPLTWFSQRANHVPDADLDMVAYAANVEASRLTASTLSQPTPAQWVRAVEKAQADYVAGRLVRQLKPRL